MPERTWNRFPDPSRPLDIGVYGARGIPSTYSGYETFLTLLLPELARRGDRVTMYCRSGEGFEGSDWQGVRRVVLPAVAGKNSSTLTHGAVAAMAARTARHDVVLVVNVANAAFCALGRYSGQPVVLNVDGQEWLRGKWGGVARAIFHGSARISRRCANGLIADGAAMADVYRRDFGAASTVIPYCVTTDSWTPDDATPAGHGLEPGRYLLIAGRHNPENNMDAIAELYAATDRDLPFVVLGTANYDSPTTANLTALSRRDERIRLLGHIGGRSEFFDLVHHAATYIHGHSVGGTNPSLIEAMGSGARICANDTPFCRETLAGVAPYFSLDQPSFAAAIGSILDDDPGHDAEVRAATRARASDRFNVVDVVTAYRDLLHAAAAARWRTTTISTRWAQST